MATRLLSACSKFRAMSFKFPEARFTRPLHRLENRGLLKADWKETETGREAKFYRLTRKGRAHLDTQTASWQRLTEAIGLILGMAEEGAQ
jgi:DNA-binding PadR family transcriptional regulator